MEAVKNYVLANYPDLFSDGDNLVIQELDDAYLVEVEGDEPPVVVNKSEI
jgi:hypothetical protein